jgi:hypothetical protein
VAWPARRSNEELRIAHVPGLSARPHDGLILQVCLRVLLLCSRAPNRGYLGGWKSPRRGAENALNRRKISSEWKLWEGSVYRWWRRDLRADDRSFDPFTHSSFLLVKAQEKVISELQKANRTLEASNRALEQRVVTIESAVAAAQRPRD